MVRLFFTFIVISFSFLVGFMFSRSPAIVPEGHFESASTATPWSWSGARFTQTVRCEGAFSSFPGPRYRWRPEGPLREYKGTLKFLEFNMLNLFERDFRISGIEGSGMKPKTPEQSAGAARIIRQSDPDIMVWIEVENQKAAELFDRKYLEDRYQEFVIEGNDSRGIDIALMVKKDLPFEVEYRSLKDLRDAQNQGPIFSRDLPVAVFRRLDRPDEPVEFIIIGTHKKSQRGGDGGAGKRKTQMEATLMAVESLQAEFGPDVPILLTGDFNNDVHGAPEFADLKKTRFQDALDLDPTPVPKDNRGTHFYFPPGNAPPEINQIDAFLVMPSPTLKVLNAQILPHLDKDGQPLNPPRTFAERETRASDHLATEVEIHFGP